MYDASSGSVNLNVKSDKVFTFNQIVAASKSLRSYVETHGYLPTTVSVNGISVNITSFAYLMSKSVININNGKNYLEDYSFIKREMVYHNEEYKYSMIYTKKDKVMNKFNRLNLK